MSVQRYEIVALVGPCSWYDVERAMLRVNTAVADLGGAVSAHPAPQASEPVSVPCKTCGGSKKLGHASGLWWLGRPCPDCQPNTQTCKTCRGTGTVGLRVRCVSCLGSGRVPVQPEEKP